jgi:DNA replication protein DnaC
MSDLLIVDDFNFISNKEACLYEICSYIERRLQLSKMTMFVANYPLQEIRDKFIKGDYKNMDFYKRFFDRIKQKVQENTFFIDKLETK